GGTDRITVERDADSTVEHPVAHLVPRGAEQEVALVGELATLQRCGGLEQAHGAVRPPPAGPHARRHGACADRRGTSSGGRRRWARRGHAPPAAPPRPPRPPARRW